VGTVAATAWRDAAVGFDALVHTAYEPPAKGVDLDRQALDTLISAAKLTGGRPRLVYTSEAWVIGPTSSPADEQAQPIPAAYSAWRLGHEQHLLGTTGLTPVVIRPGIVYGGSRGIVGDLLRDGMNGLVRVIGDGRNRWATIYDRDLADLYVRLVSAPGVSGVYHATDEADESVVEIVDALARNTTHRPDARFVPIAEARAKLGPYADALAMDQVVRSPRAKALGWMPGLRSIAGNVPRLLEEWRNGQKD
jgi:nucleoside-diphosphate-sugar epimerase